MPRVLSYRIKWGDTPRFLESSQDVFDASSAQCCIARKMASRFRILSRNVFVFGCLFIIVSFISSKFVFFGHFFFPLLSS